MTQRVIDGFVLERAAVICPECQSPFSTEFLVESRKLNSADIIEADMHRIYSDPQIRAAMLGCCPACTFCAWKTQFKPFKIKAELLRKESAIEPGKKYALAVKWARQKKVHSLDTAFIAINGLWCARESNEADNLWLELAIYEHVKGVAASPSRPEDDGMTHLYLGELYRQHRDFDKALSEYDLAEFDQTSPKDILAHLRSLAQKGLSNRAALPLKVARLYFEVEDNAGENAGLLDFNPPQESVAEPVAAQLKASQAQTSTDPAENQREVVAAEQAVASFLQENASESADSTDTGPLLAAISSLFSEKGSFLTDYDDISSDEEEQKVEKSAPATVAASADSAQATTVKATSAQQSNTTSTAGAATAQAASQAATAPAIIPASVQATSPAISSQPSLRVIPQTTRQSFAPSIRTTSFGMGSAAAATASFSPIMRAVPAIAPVTAALLTPVKETATASLTEPATTPVSESAKAQAPEQAIKPVSESTKTQATEKTAKSAPAVSANTPVETAKPAARPTKKTAAGQTNATAKSGTRAAAPAPRSRASVITAPPSSSVTVSVTAIKPTASAASQKAASVQKETGAKTTESTTKPVETARTDVTATRPAVSAARTGGAESKPEVSESKPVELAAKSRGKQAKPPKEDFYFARNLVASNVPPNRNGWKNDYVNQVVTAVAAPTQSIREEKVEPLQKPAETLQKPAETVQVQRTSEPQQGTAANNSAPGELAAPLPGLAIDDPVRGKDYSDAINRVESYLSFSRRVSSRNWIKL